MARLTTNRLLVAFLGMTMLAACGGEASFQVPPARTAAEEAPAIVPDAPVATAKPTKKPAAKATAKPTAKPVAATVPVAKASAKPAAKPAAKPTAAATPAPTPDATQTLAGLKTTFEALSSTQTSNSVTDCSKDRTKTIRTKSVTRFQAPNNYRMEVLESTVGSKVGSRVVLKYGEQQAKVKAGGILGIATLTLQLTDEKLLTSQGWHLDKIVVKGMLERVTGSDYKSTVFGTTTIGGEAVTVLKVTAAQNTLDADIEYELIAYDAADNIRMWAAYAKPSLSLPQNLLYQMVIDKVETNLSFPASTFQL